MMKIVVPLGLERVYGAAHAVEGRGAFSCGAAWSAVGGTTQRTFTACWVVPQENAPRPSTACAAP